MSNDRSPKEEKSDLDRALEALLVGEATVKIDPATGEVLERNGEKSSLTDSEEPNTIA